VPLSLSRTKKHPRDMRGPHVQFWAQDHNSQGRRDLFFSAHQLAQTSYSAIVWDHDTRFTTTARWGLRQQCAGLSRGDQQQQAGPRLPQCPDRIRVACRCRPPLPAAGLGARRTWPDGRLLRAAAVAVSNSTGGKLGFFGAIRSGDWSPGNGEAVFARACAASRLRYTGATRTL
jgi:hypothetical protein